MTYLQYPKRTLCVSMMSATLLATIAGCGSPSTATGHQPVVLHVLMEQGNVPPVTQKFLATVKKEFEARYPHIQVKLATYPATSTSTTLDTMIASHHGPNVFEIGTTFIPTLTASRAFVPWSRAMLQTAHTQELVPASTRMDYVPGHRPIGLPDSAEPFVLWYNKAMFRAAHIAHPPTTWGEFIADAKKLTHPSRGVWGAAIAPADPFYSMHITWLLSRQMGGAVINARGTQAQFASLKVATTIRFYLDMLKTFHVVSPADVQYTEQDMISAFMQGKAAMVPVGGLYDLSQLNSNPEFLKHDVGAAPNPIVPYGLSHVPKGGVKAESFISGQEQVIFKYSSSSAQVAAATKWIGYYDSPSVQYQMWKAYGALPVNQQAYTKTALSTPLWKSFETIETHSYPTPRVPGWLTMPTVYDKNLATVFDDIALHKYSPGQLTRTLRSVDSQINTSIAGLKTP